MQEIGWIGLEWMMCLVELIIFHIFMERNCEKREVGKIPKMLIILGTGILLYVKDYWQINDIVAMLLCSVILIVYSVALFKAKEYIYPIYAFTFILMITICDIICIGGVSILFSNIQVSELLGLHGRRYIVGLISKLLAFCFVIVVSCKRQMISQDYRKENLFVILLVFLSSLICMFSLLRIKQNSYEVRMGQQIDLAMCFIALSIFSIDMIIYGVIRQLNVKVNQEKDIEIVQCQNELLTKAILDNQEIEKEWRKIQHDFNNHISCIDMLLQMQNITKAREYIQNLTKSWQENDLSIHSGNEIVDAVINQKAIQAKSYKIIFFVSGNIEGCTNIEDVDLCALLSNSIDNAIEAAKQVLEEENRRIDVTFGNRNGKLLIDVKNAVKQNIDTREKLITTKNDRKRHGIGMMSMQTTVNKYDGYIAWRCEDYQFHLNIEIPVL